MNFNPINLYTQDLTWFCFYSPSNVLISTPLWLYISLNPRFSNLATLRYVEFNSQNSQPVWWFKRRLLQAINASFRTSFLKIASNTSKNQLGVSNVVFHVWELVPQFTHRAIYAHLFQLNYLENGIVVGLKQKIWPVLIPMTC